MVPAGAELRQTQVGGKLPAAEPDRLLIAAAAVAAGQERDGVAGDLVGVAGAVPLTDLDSGPSQPVRELLPVLRPGQCRPDPAAQHLAIRTGRRRQTRLGAGTNGGLVLPELPAGRLPARRSIHRAGRRELVLPFDVETDLAGAVEVVVREHPTAVLAHQGRDDVHVVVGVPDRDPPDGVTVPALGQSQP
ncbi:MAG: hypothetical protein M3467_08465, partial [Actinomycetota bacterium]|nr:hypothetical protein [Actinomycetota bacterium]